MAENTEDSLKFAVNQRSNLRKMNKLMWSSSFSVLTIFISFPEIFFLEALASLRGGLSFFSSSILLPVSAGVFAQITMIIIVIEMIVIKQIHL